MTLICVLGTDLSARLQNILIGAQVGALLLFAGVALAKVAGGDAPEGSIDPSLSWLNPFAIDATSALVAGLLTGVFIYWGWESAVNLTEEVEDSATAPGRAAVLSTVILLVTYVSVAVAVVAFAGLDRIAEFEDDDAIFSTLASDVLGTPLDQLVVLAVLTSALASTQTTILPASRTTLSMARARRCRPRWRSIHPRFLTPDVSTWVIGALAAIWYAVVNSLSENFLFDTLSALSLMIAFYYALSGIACVVYYRHELTPRSELPLHRRRAAARRGDPRLPARALGDRPVRSGGVLLAGARCSASGCRCSSAPRSCARRGADGRVAVAGPRGYFERRPFEALPRDFVPGEAAPELARRRPGNRWPPASCSASTTRGLARGARRRARARRRLGEPLHVAFAAAPPTHRGGGGARAPPRARGDRRRAARRGARGRGGGRRPGRVARRRRAPGRHADAARRRARRPPDRRRLLRREPAARRDPRIDAAQVAAPRERPVLAVPAPRAG